MIKKILKRFKNKSKNKNKNKLERCIQYIPRKKKYIDYEEGDDK